MQFLYFVIPTCNGEIMGFPSIFTKKENAINFNEECVIYEIDLLNQLITEIN